MTGDKLFDCTEMFRHACSFLDCADFCCERENRINYVQPEIVNSSLACEVFLKAICHYHDIDLKSLIKKKHGHSLKALYEAIPTQIQKDINRKVGIGDDRDLKDAFGFDYLDKISNSFEDWRYSYEHKSLRSETWFLIRFRNALRDVCCLLFYKTTWDEYKRR